MKTTQLLLCLMIFSSSQIFAQNGADMSMIPYRQGDKWGYASPDKNIIIQPKYAGADFFSQGYASVKIGTKYGYINKVGKLVIPAKYTVAKPFRKGYIPNAKNPEGDSVLFAGASLVASGEEICINIKGIRMWKCPAIAENSFEQNKIPVETKTTQKTYSLPNSNGLFDKIVDDYKISGNDETYYIAMKNNQYGVFNSKFDTIVPFQYNSIKVNRKSSTPYLEVNRGGMLGLMNTNGTMAIYPEYTNMVSVDGPDNQEYVIIRKDGKTYVKDINNKDIISTGYSDIIYDDGGFIVTGDNNMRGYYFSDNTVIQPKYKEVKLVKGTKYLMVKTSSGKVGYINNAGEEYFSE